MQCERKARNTTRIPTHLIARHVPFTVTDHTLLWFGTSDMVYCFCFQLVRDIDAHFLRRSQ